MLMSAIQDFKLQPVLHDYTPKDTMLYALGLGYGSNPMDPSELAFVYEQDLKAVPALCGVLAHPGFWAKDPKFEIDWVKILHGEQSFEIHSPMPAKGRARGEYAIEAVEDKGPDKGAILHQVKRLYDDETNTLLATVRSVLFMRGDGGCGSFGTPPAAGGAIAEGLEAFASFELPTLPQQALIYRLSGDFNPIHADPIAAGKAGFERPILHGLCTFGLATRSAIQVLAPGEPERLRGMSARFSKPVFPGETIITEFFREGDAIRFRCRVKERNLMVLDRGSIELAP